MKDEVIKVANIIIESIVYLFSRSAFVKKFAPPPEDFYSKSHHIRRFSQGTLYQAILKKRLILSSPLSLLHVPVWSPTLNRRSYQLVGKKSRSIVLTPLNNVVPLIYLAHHQIVVRKQISRCLRRL